MSYTIQIDRSAKKQLAKISDPFASAISAKIESLKDNPRPPGCIKLVDSQSWRVRVGDYRVIYNILDTVLLIIVIEIGNRKQVYR